MREPPAIPPQAQTRLSKSANTSVSGLAQCSERGSIVCRLVNANGSAASSSQPNALAAPVEPCPFDQDPSKFKSKTTHTKTQLIK